MNPDYEMMGKMRLAHRAVCAARQEMHDGYEDGSTMLTPDKADELVRLVKEMDLAMSDIKPIVEEFHVLGTRRKNPVL